jgi:hypothetical protein
MQYYYYSVAIPGDRNVIKKEAEKILKYKDPIIQIQRMRNVKTKVEPLLLLLLLLLFLFFLTFYTE